MVKAEAKKDIRVWDGFTTGLIIGAGAVKNAWAPILRVIKKEYELPSLDADAANCLLATLIYDLREHAGHKAYITEDVKNGYKLVHNRIRVSIAKEIASSQQKNEIRPHAEFKGIVEKFILPESKFLTFITTNWDTVIDEEISKLVPDEKIRVIGPLHIHGKFDAPARMYLPAEVIGEPYRTEHEKGEMEFDHHVTTKFFLKTNRLIIYGLSLSALDAELLTTIYGGIMLSTCLGTVCIIDPNHEKVALRLRALIGTRRKITILGFCPSDLDRPIDYSF